jgi:UDPglucose 6-dehydrogenase
MEKTVIGVIGCGIVGGNTARLFEVFAPDKVEVLKYDRYKDGDWKTVAEIVDRSEIIFVCLPTPMKDNGAVDLEYVHGAFSEIDHYIGRKTRPEKIVAIRSTVVPGSANMLYQMFSSMSIAVVPEFLTEKQPWTDMCGASRIVIGASDFHVHEQLEKLFKMAYGEEQVDYIRMSLSEAEMYKYACNYFLAMSVLAANELYGICQAIGIDYQVIQENLKYDMRIGTFTQVPGHDGDYGIGGKCLPKDINALAHKAEQKGYRPFLLREAIKLNERVRKNKDWLTIKGAVSSCRFE